MKRIECLMIQCDQTFASEGAMEKHHEKEHSSVWDTDRRDRRDAEKREKESARWWARYREGRL